MQWLSINKKNFVILYFDSSNKTGNFQIKNRSSIPYTVIFKLIHFLLTQPVQITSTNKNIPLASRGVSILNCGIVKDD